MKHHVLSTRGRIITAAGALLFVIVIVANVFGGDPTMRDMGIQPNSAYGVVVSSSGNVPADQSAATIVIKAVEQKGKDTIIQLEIVSSDGSSHSLEVKEAPDTAKRTDGDTSQGTFLCPEAAANDELQESLNNGTCVLQLELTGRDVAALQ